MNFWDKRGALVRHLSSAGQADIDYHLQQANAAFLDGQLGRADRWLERAAIRVWGPDERPPGWEVPLSGVYCRKYCCNPEQPRDLDQHEDFT